MPLCSDRAGWCGNLAACPRCRWAADNPDLKPRLGSTPPTPTVTRRRPADPTGGGWVDIPAPPPVALTPKSKLALVTVVVGDEAERCFAASGPHMRRFAAENGYDFHVSRWPGNPAWPMSAKFGVSRFLDHYDAVLYADADVLFRPGCADPLDYVGADGFGACDELPFHRKRTQDPLEAGFEAWRRSAGLGAGAISHYFNAGVTVATKASRHLIDPPARLWVGARGMNNHCAEQHLLNARVIESGFRVTTLPRTCNWQSWTCESCDGKKVFDGAPADAVLHWSGGRTRPRRAADLAGWAARHPWPWAPPDHLFENPRNRHYADARHVSMLHAELMSGGYGRVLEIGCYHGYSTTALLDAYRQGEIGEVHLCDVAPTPELRKVIDHYTDGIQGARVHVNEMRSVDLLAGYVSFDFAFIDGDHSEDTVREELRLLVAAGVRTIALHDTAPAAGTKYGVAPGPRLARGYLEAHGYTCREDAEERPGERTERGLLIATRGLTPPPVGARLSIVVATTGRPTLARTLASITAQMVPGDELIVERDNTGDMAATPRTRGMNAASGDYVLFMDDDDTYEPGAFDLIRAAARRDPGRVHLFRLTSGAGWGLGAEPVVRRGNVSTQMVCIPNDPAKFGVWGPRRSGDFDFIASTLAHYPDGAVWHRDVIATWRPG